MATLGELVVNLIAKTAPFESGMKRSAVAVRSLESASDKAGLATGRFFSSLAAGAVGLLSVSRGIAAITSEMAKLDTAIKLADRTGLNFEHLQGLAFGADLSGVNFESLSSALERYSANLGKAQYGTSRAKQALDALHLSASSLAKLDLPDQVKLLADRLNALPSADLRIGIARDLFGDPAILTFLAEGSTGIETLTRRAQELGLIAGRDAAEGIVKANDALAELSMVVRTLWRDVATSVAGPVTNAARAGSFGFGAARKGMSFIGRLGLANLRDAVATVGSGAIGMTPAQRRQRFGFGGNLEAEQRAILRAVGGPIVGITSQAERDQIFGRRMASQSLLGLAGAAGQGLSQGLAGMAGGLRAMGEGIGAQLGAVIRPAVAEQSAAWQAALFRGRLTSGIGAIASFGQSLVAGVDISEAFRGVGAGDGGQAKVGGSRAAIEAQAQRSREQAMEIEKAQLIKLQEMAKSLLDPARIMTIIQTSLT